MNNEERLSYYLGEMYNLDRAIVTKSHQNFETITTGNPTNRISRMNYTTLQHKHIMKNYSQKLLKLLEKGGHDKKSFLYCIGDVENDLKEYCFTKNRSGQDRKSVLLKCPNYSRHWNLVHDTSQFNDIPFNTKSNKLVWRGVTTGQPSRPGNRFTLMKKYFGKYPEIDVGFNGICQGKDEYAKYKTNGMSITDLLTYKYILMIEGNDKASGLNWSLASNSLVFMPKPTKFSWLMEDKLIPNIHYIQVNNDFSDLQTKVQWCNENPGKCKKIIRNANQYMNQFMDVKREEWLELEVLNRYFGKISLPTL
jgi:hypothetical protein